MFKKILYPTDFSALSEQALKYVIQLKKAGTEEVVVLHVIDKNAIRVFSKLYWEEFSITDLKLREKAQIALKPIEEELKGHGFRVKIQVAEGIPFREILRAEEEKGITATVIGAHGASNVEEMLLGSVSEKVIRKAKKPVLVIKG